MRRHVVDALAVDPHLAAVAQALEIFAPGQRTRRARDDIFGPAAHAVLPRRWRRRGRRRASIEGSNPRSLEQMQPRRYCPIQEPGLLQACVQQVRQGGSVPHSEKPILVVGGGIGGLSTALALGRKGLPVRVLEQTPELGAIGYGIQLGPNVFPMFDRLGIRDAVLAESILPGACRMLDALSGEEITRVVTGRALRERFAHPYIVLHRVDLHHVLMHACRQVPRIALESSAAVTGYEDRGDRVLALTEDGRTIEGAALIAADGLRSRIRAQLLGDGEPRPIGYVAHRTIVPMEQVTADVHRADVVLWAGPGFHIVHYPLRHGTLFNIVAGFPPTAHPRQGALA